MKSITIQAPLGFWDNLSVASLGVISESLSCTEANPHTILQPVQESLGVFGDTPPINMIDDAIQFQEDASGFVVGGQITVYITDPRFVIGHFN
jgi:hypothetical protein